MGLRPRLGKSADGIVATLLLLLESQRVFLIEFITPVTWVEKAKTAIMC